MKRAEPFRDVEREMQRFMVNLYKRSIRKGRLDPKNLKPKLSDLHLPPTHSGGRKARPYDGPAHPVGRGGVNPRPQGADLASTP